jgi:hypothetical protein
MSAMDFLRNSPKQEALNLFLEIATPFEISDRDRRVCQKVDSFLREHDCSPLSTVSNTIFPADLYLRYGKEGVFNIYPDEVYPIVKRCKNNWWGTYAHRMVRRTNAAGETVNPLERIVERLKSQALTRSPKRSIYELDPIDPCLDISLADPSLPGPQKIMGAPCLSHLSFKLVGKKTLNLTAIYRLHHYVEKTLGNLIGLSALQNFVAKEANLEVGTLSVLSTFGKIEHSSSFKNAEVMSLLEDCASLLKGRRMIRRRVVVEV